MYIEHENNGGNGVSSTDSPYEALYKALFGDFSNISTSATIPPHLRRQRNQQQQQPKPQEYLEPPKPEQDKAEQAGDSDVDEEEATENISSWTVSKHISKSPMLDAMATVRLNDVDSGIYRDLLLLKRSIAGRDYKYFYKDAMPEYLMELSAGINRVFTCLRTVCAKAVQSPTELPPDEVEQIVNNSITAFASSDADPEWKREIYKSFCAAMSSGTNHIIYEDRDTNSYTVEFCGFSPKNEGEKAGMCIVNDFMEGGLLPPFDTRSAEARQLGPFTPYSESSSVSPIDLSKITAQHKNLSLILACKRLAISVLSALFGTHNTLKQRINPRTGKNENVENVDSAHLRLKAKFALNHDFGQLLNNLELTYESKIDGKSEVVKIPLNQVFNTTKVATDIPKRLGFNLADYVSVMLYREPDPTITSIYINKLSSLLESRQDPESANNPVSVTEQLRSFIDNDKFVNKAAFMLQPVITASFAIRIPYNVATFISQATPPMMFDLNNWISTWAKAAIAREKPLEPERVPLFVFPLTRIPELLKLREKYGYSYEQGKNNEDGIFVNDKGRLNFAPKENDDIGAQANADLYSKAVSSYLDNLYNVSIPFSGLGLDPACDGTPGFSSYNNAHLLPDRNATNNVDIEKVLSTKRRIGRVVSFMRGALLSNSWNSGVSCKASSWAADGESDPGFVDYTSLHQAAVPDKLDIADYLGYNFGEYEYKDANGDTKKAENKKSAGQAYHLLFPGAKHVVGTGTTKTETDLDEKFSLAYISESSPFKAFINAYCYFVLTGHLKPFFSLVEITRKKDNWKNIKAFSQKDTPQDWISRRSSNLYFSFLENDFVVKSEDQDDPVYATYHGISSLLLLASKEAHSITNDSYGILLNLRRMRDVDYTEFYVKSGDTLSEFKKVYKFFGGGVFLTAIQQFLSLDKSKVFTIDRGDYDKMQSYHGKIKLSNNPGVDDLHRPSYDELSEIVYPFCVMFGNYVYDSDEFLKSAVNITSVYKNEAEIEPDDIEIPDIEKGDSKGRKAFKFFPHQFRAARRLFGDISNGIFPRKAVFDISAGGGKTATYISEIGRLSGLVANFKEENPNDEIPDFRPLVVCPSNLVKSVANEATKFLGKTWNVVPITSDVFNGTWGQDKLNALLHNPDAPIPPNTIFITGYDFLATNKFNVSIGNRVTPIYGALEFVKKLACNYIVFDESHYLKNPESTRHLLAKMLASSSSTHFIRMATGTMIPNSVKDILGQTAIMGTNIFRTEREFNAAFYKNAEGTSVDTLKPDARDRIMDILSSFSSVITARRREWAHLYPDLIIKRNIVPIAYEYIAKDGTLGNQETLDSQQNLLGILHRQIYEAVLGRARDALINKFGIKPAVPKDYKDNEERVLGIDSENGGELGGVEEQLLEYWMQRVEQAITDPFGDSRIFDDDSEDSFAKPREELESRKAQEIQMIEDGYKKLKKRFGKRIKQTKVAELDQRKKNDLENLNAKYENLFALSKNIHEIKSNRNAEASNVDNYFPPKILECVNIINQHFETPDPWKERKTYKVYDRVRFNNHNYVAKRFYDKDETRETIFVSAKNPEQDRTRWYQEKVPGRIIVVCAYTRTANTIERALIKKSNIRADDIKKYIGAGGDELLADYANPTNTVKVLIANEKKIQVGHNLQISSRIIRLETPWTPGEVDQTMSRMFRPDTVSEERRPVVNVDWMLTSPSMEIPKMMKLVAKSIETTKLSEYGNENYAALDTDEYDLPIIKMAQDVLIHEDSSETEEAKKYFAAYDDLVDMQQRDIDESRAVTAQHEAVAPNQDTPIPKTFRAAPHKPMVIDQDMKDIHDLGLTKLTEYLNINETEFNNYVANQKSLDGKLVMTQYGSAQILKTTPNVSYDVQGNPYINKTSPIHSVKVKLVNCFKYMNTTTLELNPLSVFIIKDIKEAKRLGLTTKTKIVGTRRGKVILDEDAHDAARQAEAKRIRQAIQNGNTRIGRDAARNTATQMGGGDSGIDNTGLGDPDLDDADLDGMGADSDDNDSGLGMGENTGDVGGDQNNQEAVIYPVVINNQYALIDYFGEATDQLLSTRLYRKYGGFVSAKAKRPIDFIGIVSYLNEKIKAHNQTNTPKLSVAGESVQEFIAIRNALLSHSSLTGSSANVRLPIFKTAAFDKTFLNVYQGILPDSDIYLFYMFEAAFDAEGDLQYDLKLCIQHRSLSSTLNKLGVKLNTTIRHKFNLKKGNGEQSYEAVFKFEVEPVKAMSIMQETGGSVGRDPKAVIKQAMSHIERTQKALGDSIPVSGFNIEDAIESYHDHFKQA